MNRILVATVCLTATILLSACASEHKQLTARERIEVPDNPKSVWDKYGDFCSVENWHPAVETCETMVEKGDTFRILTLADGAILKEKYLGKGELETSYRYEIVEGPLPVKNYMAYFEIKLDDDDAGIKWMASFDADGVNNEEAIQIVQGIYESGLAAIKADYK